MTIFTVKKTDERKESSIIHRVHYDYDDEMLDVTFHDAAGNEGETYRYFDVPSYIVEAWMSANSIGSFFVKNIKNGKFDFEKLELNVL